MSRVARAALSAVDVRGRGAHRRASPPPHLRRGVSWGVGGIWAARARGYRRAIVPWRRLPLYAVLGAVAAGPCVVASWFSTSSMVMRVPVVSNHLINDFQRDLSDIGCKLQLEQVHDNRRHRHGSVLSKLDKGSAKRQACPGLASWSVHIPGTAVLYKCQKPSGVLSAGSQGHTPAWGQRARAALFSLAR